MIRVPLHFYGDFEHCAYRDCARPFMVNKRLLNAKKNAGGKRNHICF